MRSTSATNSQRSASNILSLCSSHAWLPAGLAQNVLGYCLLCYTLETILKAVHHKCSSHSAIHALFLWTLCIHPKHYFGEWGKYSYENKTTGCIRVAMSLQTALIVYLIRNCRAALVA